MKDSQNTALLTPNTTSHNTCRTITGETTAVSLAGDWILTGHGEHGERIKVPCHVPGDVHAALITANLLPDPYYGMNEIHTQWAGRKNWTVARDFTVDDIILAKKTVKLRLEDVDTFATIRVNGIEVGKCSNRFRRYDFEIRQFLKAGVNRVEGAFTSAELLSDALAEERGTPYPMSNSLWAKNLALIRKPACHGGWDWGPAVMVMGFCGKVELLASDGPTVDYVYTTQSFNDDLSHCKLKVFADLSDGTTLTDTVEIDNPPLWWPNGCGEQRFYEYEAVIGGQKLRRRIGLRKLEVLNERTKSAEGKEELSVVFRVNNRRIFCKGANWIPCDAVDAWQTPGKYRSLLESAASAHMNMIRLWGGGQYEKDTFYDICDELGILIWHDMMESCAVYPADDAFLHETGEELSHQLRRLRDHASIAIWCGDNECLGAVNWFSTDAKQRDDRRAEWEKRSKFKGELVAKYDPARVYWPSSPCCGPGDFGNGWKDDSKGDMHNWRVWHDNCPFDEYYRFRPRFCSEFGYQSFPSFEIAKTFASEEQILSHGPDFEWHQKNRGGNRRIRETMARYFPPPKDVPSELLISQFQHGMAMKMAVDGWRAQRPRCMGTLIWQLNDLWPVASWSMLEYGGKWKPLQYMAKRFYAPVSIVAQPLIAPSTDPAKQSAVDLKHGRITVLNDTGATVRGEVVAEYWSYDGQIVSTDCIPVEIAPDSVADAGTFTAIDGTFLVMNLVTPEEICIASNDWHFGFYKDMPLGDSEVIARTGKTDKGWEVALSTDKPAFFVWANIEGEKGEFDDNCFTLLPGRPRTIRFSGSYIPEKFSLSHLRSITC